METNTSIYSIINHIKRGFMVWFSIYFLCFYATKDLKGGYMISSLFLSSQQSFEVGEAERKWLSRDLNFYGLSPTSEPLSHCGSQYQSNKYETNCEEAMENPVSGRDKKQVTLTQDCCKVLRRERKRPSLVTRLQLSIPIQGEKRKETQKY